MPQGLSIVGGCICPTRQASQLDFLMDLPKRESCVTLGSLFLPIRAKFVVPGFSRNFRLQAVLRGGTTRRYREAVLRTIFPSSPARESFGEELGELVVGDRLSSLCH